MINTAPLGKLFLVLAIVAATFALVPAETQAVPGPCAFECTNPFFGTSCASISCVCDAAGGQVLKCTQCADNDYTCQRQDDC